MHDLIISPFNYSKGTFFRLKQCKKYFLNFHYTPFMFRPYLILLSTDDTMALLSVSIDGNIGSDINTINVRNSVICLFFIYYFDVEKD